MSENIIHTPWSEKAKKLREIYGLSLGKIAQKYGLTLGALSWRLRHGWTIEQALAKIKEIK